MGPRDIGLHLEDWWLQLFIALTGLPLSVVGHFLLRPKPLLIPFSWPELTLASAILIVFLGFTEEIIFRGLFQHVATEIFGRAGLVL